MRFSIEDSEVTSRFKVDGRLAPDQLIAATRVFSPDLVITSSNRISHDEYDWSIAGLTQAGICLVKATAKTNPAKTDMPFFSDVQAEWIPLEAITRISLQDVREASEYYDHTKEVAIEAVWTLDLHDRGPLVLPADPPSREGAVWEFAQQLLDRRQHATGRS